jgi:hypothetical protein
MDDNMSISGGLAFGRPGIPPGWTSSAKEGVGTAYSTGSRVWFWHEPDRPGQSRHFGQCADAAMPLMWAHAECIKLLRSMADGQAFDRIPIVAKRYLNKRGRKDLEAWRLTRRLRAISAVEMLQIQAQTSFRLRWTSDAGRRFRTVLRSRPASVLTSSILLWPAIKGRQYALRSCGLRRNAGKARITK